MPGPPANVDPADLFSQLCAMPRPHRVVDFPRKGEDGRAVGQIAMWVLAGPEMDAATASAERWTRKLLKEQGGVPAASERSDGYTNIFENRCAKEILFRVCRRLNDLGRPFFPTIEGMTEAHITSDELGVLMATYNLIRSEVGPIVSRMSQEEFEAWLEVLAKGGASYPLAGLSLAARTDLTMRLAKELWASRMDSSSSGTPPDEPTLDS